jgi:hypothetical protein
MLALVLEHLCDAFEILVFSDDVHVPCNCSIKGWNMSMRLCADVGTKAATSWCNFENLFFRILSVHVPFYFFILWNMYLLIGLLVCEYS